MQIYDNSSEEIPTSTWQNIIDWAQIHYRDRLFGRDEQIPTRPQLIYLVNKGAVRLVSQSEHKSTYVRPKRLESPQVNSADTPLSPKETGDSFLMTRKESSLPSSEDRLESLSESEDLQPEESFLGFVSAKQPFEIVAQSSFNICAYAHVDQTQVVWLYWKDLENWSGFSQQLYEAFRYQHQRKLLWLSALGQRKTIDRLTSFLSLLLEEHGISQEGNYCLPYSLTHAQIGSAIGSTRVTVTRLMGKLRRKGIISIKDDNSICLNLERLTSFSEN